MTLIIVFTNVVVIANLSFKSKYSFLDNLDKVNKLNPQKESANEKTINVYNKGSELYNDFLGIYFDE